jgi:hypothetical protein
MGSAQGPSPAAAVHQTHPKKERRAQEGDRILGGRRAYDPPLTTRLCADWCGMTTAWVREAIDVGHQLPGRRERVKLEAETITLNRRRVHRIHLDAFIAFLRAIGWRRLPRSPRAFPRATAPDKPAA